MQMPRNYIPAIMLAEARFLLDEMDRLASERDEALTVLSKERLKSANRLAAIRATLSADRDGEPDPLTYLREHLSDEDHRSGQ